MRAVLLVLTALVLGASPASASVYRGVMTNGAGPVHSGEQGAIWETRFVEHHAGRVAYSACVIFPEKRGVVSCKAGKTNASGVDRIGFSSFVNQHPGHWVVRFFKLGRTLSSWRFAVRPEGA